MLLRNCAFSTLSQRFMINSITSKDLVDCALSFPAQLRAASARSRHDALSTTLPERAYLQTQAAACTGDNPTNRLRRIRLPPTFHCPALRATNAPLSQRLPARPARLRKERNRRSRFRPSLKLRQRARRRLHSDRKSKPIVRSSQTQRPAPA